MCRDVRNARGIKERKFGQYTIRAGAAQGLAHFFVCNPAFQPFRIENRSDSVTSLHSRYALPHGADDTRAVR